MTMAIRLAGMAILVLALAHVAMPRALNWRQQMASVDLMSRQIHYAHYVFLVVTLMGIGFLALLRAPLLIRDGDLGQSLTGGIAAFFLLRLLFELFFFDSSLWRGDRLRTVGHVAFIALWTTLTATFALATLGWGGTA